MKALTGNFALLSVNLLVRCIQSILLGSVIERNVSLRLNFRRVRRLVIFHLARPPFGVSTTILTASPSNVGSALMPDREWPLLFSWLFWLRGIPSFQTMRLPSVLAPSMFYGRAKWGNLVSGISSGRRAFGSASFRALLLLRAKSYSEIH